MAGRQRTIAKKVAALAAKSDRLGAALYELMPQLYKDRANNNQSLSPINAAWNEAMLAMCESHRAIRNLSQLLGERAEAKLSPDICPFLPLTSGSN
jgi:hypothetical protein